LNKLQRRCLGIWKRSYRNSGCSIRITWYQCHLITRNKNGKHFLKLLV